VDIGFYIIDCDNSSKNNKLIEILDNMISENPYDNIILFNNRYRRVDAKKKFPILHLSQAKYFRGTLICFDIRSLSLARTFPGPNQHIFCCDSPEWTMDPMGKAIMWKNLYENEEIKIITYEKEMNDLLSLCWDTKNLTYLTDFNAKELYGAIQKI